MTPSSEVQLVALTKIFGRTVAVDAISAEIPAGRYCCHGPQRGARERACGPEADIRDGLPIALPELGCSARASIASRPTRLRAVIYVELHVLLLRSPLYSRQAAQITRVRCPKKVRRYTSITTRRRWMRLMTRPPMHPTASS